MFCRMQNNAIQCVANLQTYIVSEFDNYLGLSNFDLWFQDTDESCCFGNGSFLFRNIILILYQPDENLDIYHFIILWRSVHIRPPFSLKKCDRNIKLL